MDKDIVKEIFLLLFEVIKALCGILWEKIKGLFVLIWDRFFGMSDVSREQSPCQEWGVTGEDAWPCTPEVTPEKPGEMERREEKEPAAYAPEVPELPESYGDNRIVLMMKDPSWLFCYWELRKDVVDSVLNMLGDKAHTAKIVLRVYDVTDITFNGSNAHTYFDIEVTGKANNWHIHTGKPERRFCVDIGFRAYDGTFCTLASSNALQTPRIGESEVRAEEWMCIEEFYERAYSTMSRGMGEYIPERSQRDWQRILKGGVSSSEFPKG